MSRVETKVQASSLAAAVSGAALWALSSYVFKGGDVPAGLVSLIDVVVPAVLAAVAGYLAPHTPRPAPGTVTTVANPMIITGNLPPGTGSNLPS
jgi:hypothetical protein